MKLLAGYRSALGTPGVARVVAALLVCFLLSGMVNLSLLLSTAHSTGSYAMAGAVVGAYSAGVAATAPKWGSIVDRRGPRWPLAASSTAQAAAFALYVVAGMLDASGPVLVAAAAAAGCCSPPVSAVAKKLFAASSDPTTRRALFAISGLFTEVVFVIGPLVVGGIAVIASPIATVAASAVVSLVGVRWLRGAPAVSSMNRELSAGGGEAGVSCHRPAWNRPQLHILGVVVLGAVAIGALQVGVVAHADGLDVNEAPFIAAMACGGVAASFTYGALAVKGTLPGQLAGALGLYGLVILSIVGHPGAAASFVLLVLIGAATGPADAIEALILAQHTPRDAQSGGFGALTTANWLGFALGSALAGVAIEGIAPTAAIVIAATAALIAAFSLVVPRWRRHLV